MTDLEPKHYNIMSYSHRRFRLYCRAHQIEERFATHWSLKNPHMNMGRHCKTLYVLKDGFEDVDALVEALILIPYYRGVELVWTELGSHPDLGSVVSPDQAFIDEAARIIEKLQIKMENWSNLGFLSEDTRETFLGTARLLYAMIGDLDNA